MSSYCEEDEQLEYAQGVDGGYAVELPYEAAYPRHTNEVHVGQ